MKKIYNLKMRFAAMVAFCIMGAGISAQVDVVSTGGLPAGTYTTLNNAFVAINAGTHTGSIAIGISGNTVEAGACVLNGNGAGSASYTAIAIAPTVDGVSISGPTVAGRGLIELNGADNVTIDGDNPNTGGVNRNLTITNTAANTVNYTSVIRIALNTTLVNSGDNNIIRNCNINGSATGRNIATATSTAGTENTTYGIIVGGGASTVSATTVPNSLTSVATTVGAGGTALAFTALNNVIDACARGIAVQGSATTFCPNMQINNNIIGSATAGNTTTVYSRGITLQGFDNALISGNIVRNIEWFVGTAEIGLSLGDVSSSGSNSVVEKNMITGVNNKNTGTFGAYGINVNAGTNITVRNNMVSGVTGDMTGGAAFSTTFGVFGIRVGTSTNHKIYNNSVSLSGARTGTASTNLLSAALAIVGTTQTGCDVRNNILSNTLTGGNTGIAYVALFLPSGATSAMNLTLNNNAYYSGADVARQGIAQAGTAAGTNFYLAVNFNAGATAPANNLRSYTNTLSVAATNDNASYASTNAAPFISATDLHLNLGSLEIANVEQKGTPSVPVTTDIDGEVRPNATTVNPDMGADEVILANCSSANGGTASTSTPVRCNGQTVALSSVGATTGTGISYQWMVSTTSGGPYTNVVGGTGATTTSFTSAALTSGVYYFVLQTTCSFGPLTAISNQVTVTVNSLPTVAVTPTSSVICNPGGTAVTLTATGASTYTWLPVAGLTPSTGSPVSANPTAPTTYTVSGTDGNGCVNTATAVVNVGSTPSVVASANNTVICSGGNTVLNAVATLPTASYCQPVYTNGTGFGDYLSSVQLNTLNNPTGASAAPYYTLYPATGATTTALVAGATYTITLAAGTYTVNDLAAWIDYNQNGTLNDAGEKLGETDNLGASPATTSFTFTVPMTALNGPVRLRVREMDHGTTNDMDPCLAQSTYGETEDYTITISGGADMFTYAWSPSTFLSSATVASPTVTGATATTTYSLTATSLAGCSASDTAVLTVNALPVVTAMAMPATICNGDNTTLMGMGASTYTWTGGVTDMTPFAPSATATYTVTGTDANGCSNTATQTVTVNPLPTGTASASPTAICLGSTSTLTAVPSCGTFSGFQGPFAPSNWILALSNSNGSVNTGGAPASISLTSSDNGSGSSGVTGYNYTFTCSGTVSFNWSYSTGDGSQYDFPQYTVNGGAATTFSGYTMFGSSSQSGTQTIVVNSGDVLSLQANSSDNVGGSCVVNISAFSGPASDGTTTWFTALTGGTNLGTGNTLVVTPASAGTATYFAEFTSGAGCVGSPRVSVSVTVNPLPTVTATASSNTVCAGDMVTLMGGGATSYTWDNGVTDNVAFAAMSTTTYMVTGTDGNGCMNTASTTVTVNPLPAVTATASSNTVCAGDVVTLTGGGATSYTWDNGAVDNVAFVPTSTTTYMVTGTDGNGCMNTASTTVTVNPLPIVTATASSNNVCTGDMVTLMGGGATS
ncbi:MAG: GEVED domain-containing protein [Bacteroidota bacterium]|nr:GEVED domain-containing protein [Bacteroidota bacterium]